MLRHEVLQPEVPVRDRDPVAFPGLLEQREEQAQRRWQVFLDRRRDDPLDDGSPLHALQPVVEGRQRHDRLGACGVEDLLHLALAVGGVYGDDDGAGLPRAELRDEELRAVREQNRDAIPFADAEFPECCRERCALTVELTVRDGASLEQQRGGAAVLAHERAQVVQQRLVGVR
jgi:hypothetical protein